jgi:peptidoglycan/LPS O-acetylase OafA/YrhL
LSVVFFVLFPSYILLGFGIWLFGFIAYRLSANASLITVLNKVWIRIATLALLGAAIVFSSMPGVNEWLADYVVGVAYTFVLLSFLNYDLKESFMRRVVEFFSNISYTLYLVHMPLIVFTVCYLFNNDRFGFEVKPVLIFLVYFAAIIIYSYLVYFLFEKRTPQVRDWVLSKIAKSKK